MQCFPVTFEMWSVYFSVFISFTIVRPNTGANKPSKESEQFKNSDCTTI